MAVQTTVPSLQALATRAVGAAIVDSVSDGLDAGEDIIHTIWGSFVPEILRPAIVEAVLNAAPDGEIASKAVENLGPAPVVHLKARRLDLSLARTLQKTETVYLRAQHCQIDKEAFAELPADLRQLELIQSYGRSGSRVRPLDKSMLNALASRCRRLESLHLASPIALSVEMIRTIAQRLPLLRELVLRHTELLDPAAFHALAGIGSVKKLLISAEQAHSLGLRQLLSRSKAEEIEFHHTLFFSTPTPNLRRLALPSENSRLRVLRLSSCNGSPEAAYRGVRLPNLEELDVHGPNSLPEAALLSLLEAAPKLSRITLSGMGSLEATTISKLLEQERIESLDLSGCHSVTNAQIKQLIRKHPELKSLKLAGCRQITDEAFSEVLYWSKWTEINLSGTNVSARLQSLSLRELSSRTRL